MKSLKWILFQLCIRFSILKRPFSHPHMGPFMSTNCLNYGPQVSCCRAQVFRPDPVDAFPSLSSYCHTLSRRGSHFCGQPPFRRHLHIKVRPSYPPCTNMPCRPAAFVHQALYPFLSSQSLRYSQTSRTRPVSHHPCEWRRVKSVTSASSKPPPTENSQPDAGERRKIPAGPSTTIFGRIIIETLSLCVGAILLLAVLVWRLWQLVSRKVFSALLWLSNVRQLGKWAVSRFVDLDGVAASVSSIPKALRRLYEATLAGLSRVEREEKEMSSVKKQHVQTNEHETTNKYTNTPDLEVDVVRDVFYRQDAVISPGRRLILLRHAKTLWDSEADVPDHDRILSAKGKEEARVVGTELSRMSWLPDVILCSDAVRTVQTLSLLEFSGNDRVATTCTETLYYAVTGEEMAVAVDEALGDRGFTENTTLMVVCHNPGCEELVERLTGKRPEMGTGCAALLEYVGSEDEHLSTNGQAPMRLSAHHGPWALVELIRPSTILTATRPLPGDVGL